MNAEDFVKACYEEKENYIKNCFGEKITLEIGRLISLLELDKDKTDILKNILNTALTDTYYTILLALDGDASLGNMKQSAFKLLDENGDEIINGDGKTEALAYEYFFENSDKG